MQPSAEEGLPPPGAVPATLDAELSRMRMRALYARAEALGVPARELDEAEDQVDTKAALVGLIIRQTQTTLEQLREQLGAAPVHALYKRAEAVGVDCALLDAAEDAADTNSTIIDLIIRADERFVPLASDGSEPEPEPTRPRASTEFGTPRQRPDANQALGHRSVQKKNARVQQSLEALPNIFSDLAGDDQLLRFADFKEALVARLQISLSEHEIERIWNRLVKRRTVPLPAGVGILDAKLTLTEFSHGVKNISFLRCCVQSLRTGSTAFAIPSNYDYSKSTNENYGVAASEGTLVGEYVSIRQSRDYSYHTHYTPERQLWQDHAIQTVVARTERQGNPWIVYTCGPMGAGKGYALSWMSRNGYFPLEDIVCIDPDHFKKMMPEWPHYVAERSDAGSHCHRESGFLQEIAQEVAMKSSQNVWVDGSLRDGAWFAQVFKSIRRRFPHYKIAIFEVSASEEVVRQRIKQRAALEGRDIPEQLIVQSLASVADSLNILMPLADFVARINNEGPSPSLRAYIRVNADGNWSHIKRRFARPERAGSFPGALSPLLLRCVPEPSSLLLAAGASGTGEAPSPLGRLELDVRCPALASIRGAIREAKMILSPQCEVTLEGGVRALAGIPTEATSFAFGYPVNVDWTKVPDLPKHNCESLVAMAGSFVYFDAAGAVCAVNAVTSFMDDEAEEPEAHTQPQPQPLVQFCPPVPLPEESYQALEASGRLRPVTMAALLDKGAYAFAWIKPGEQLVGLTAVPKAGAFAYVFRPSTLQAALLEAQEDSAIEDDGALSRANTRFDGYFPVKHEGCYFPVAI